MPRTAYALVFIVLASSVAVDSLQTSTQHSEWSQGATVSVQDGSNSTSLQRNLEELKLNTTLNGNSFRFGSPDLKEYSDMPAKHHPYTNIIPRWAAFSFNFQKDPEQIRFYHRKLHPSLKILKSGYTIPAGKNLLMLSYSNSRQFRYLLSDYNYLKQHLQELKTECVAVKVKDEYGTRGNQLLLKTGELVIFKPSPGGLMEGNLLQQLLAFTNIQTSPLVSNLSDPRTQNRVFNMGLQTHLILLINETLPQSETNRIKSIFSKVAEAQKDGTTWDERIVFAVAPIEYMHPLTADLVQDLENAKFKIILATKRNRFFKSQRFLYPEDQLSIKSLTQFVDDFRQEKLIPLYKSEPRSTAQRGNIMKIVSKTFDEVIYGKNQNVLVLFYSSSHSDLYESERAVVEGFLDKYKSYFKDDLLVGEFDLALNEHGDLYINSFLFPSLYLFPKTNSKHPYRFTGQRTSKAIKRFVEQVIYQLKIPDKASKPLQLD